MKSGETGRMESCQIDKKKTHCTHHITMVMHWRVNTVSESGGGRHARCLQCGLEEWLRWGCRPSPQAWNGVPRPGRVGMPATWRTVKCREQTVDPQKKTRQKQQQKDRIDLNILERPQGGVWRSLEESGLRSVGNHQYHTTAS